MMIVYRKKCVEKNLVRNIKKCNHCCHLTTATTITDVTRSQQVLKCLYKFQLFANLKKCAFAVQQINFLEFIISAKEVTMNSNQISIIADWLTFNTYQEVQIFLNFVNFYWHFVKNYSKIAEFLTELLKGSVNKKKQRSLQWDEIEV